MLHLVPGHVPAPWRNRDEGLLNPCSISYLSEYPVIFPTNAPDALSSKVHSANRSPYCLPNAAALATTSDIDFLSPATESAFCTPGTDNGAS